VLPIEVDPRLRVGNPMRQGLVQRIQKFSVLRVTVGFPEPLHFAVKIAHSVVVLCCLGHQNPCSMTELLRALIDTVEGYL